MKIKNRVAVILSLIIFGQLLFSSYLNAETKINSGNSLRSLLGTMKSVYESNYAPTEWKQTHFNWNLDLEYKKALDAVEKEGNQLSVLGSREIIKNFIYSMRDYHVSVSFFSTEMAEIPFSVRSAEGKVFIVYIDRKKLSLDIFPFEEGDELVSFDGLPVNEAISKVQSEMTQNVESTDRALAEMFLTKRMGKRGYKVPSGVLYVGVKRKGSSEVQNIQLIWEYTPEKINARTDSFDSKNKLNESTMSSLFRSTEMSVNSDLMDPQSDNLYTLGSKKSFLPDLGMKLWETAEDDLFYAYITMTEDRKLIGVVRIPSYSVDSEVKSLESFQKIIAKMEASTDVLVIDQHHNPGGSLFYLYALASMLTTQSLRTPQHEVSLYPELIDVMYSLLTKFKDIVDDAGAKKLLADDYGPVFATYEFVKLFRNYVDFIIKEWNSGKKRSSPYWLLGINSINPFSTHYSKPILILVNELDFSGGDFFPAILQDNKRATVMGTRTAGAGGYVVNYSIPNNVGVSRFRVTESLAKRVSDNPIENLGVVPDVKYTLSAEDYQNNFAPYKTEIMKVVRTLIKTKE